MRRQSFEPVDLIYAHIGGIDTLARALIAAAAMIEDGALDRFVAERYAGWDRGEGAEMLAGRRGLAESQRGSSATSSIRSRVPAVRSIWRTSSIGIYEREFRRAGRRLR